MQNAAQMLLGYLEEKYLGDAALSVEWLQTFLKREHSSIDWNTVTEDGLPLLHLAVMNEVTPPAEMQAVVMELLAHGAKFDIQDSDGDTALEAVLSATEELEDRDDDPPTDDIKATHVAAVRGLILSPASSIQSSHVQSICSWLRRHVPSEMQSQVIADLESRVGKQEVRKLWSSEELLGYLELCAYDEKRGVKASKVKEFLDAGASPGHTQNGATALLLVVLNPYSDLEELKQVFHMMLTIQPEVATMRDGFKLSALQWASDYVSVAQQHNLKKANPAALLALMPAIISCLPFDVDAGEACFKVSADGQCPAATVAHAIGIKLPVTRFLAGDRVRCRIGVPGHETAWEEGVVLGIGYRERCWPTSHPGAPYEVMLDIGSRVYALVDNDRIIRREDDKQRGARSQKGPAKKGVRFRKQQREDGTWELLDTVSGKARPASPPDSDDD